MAVAEDPTSRSSVSVECKRRPRHAAWPAQISFSRRLFDLCHEARGDGSMRRRSMPSITLLCTVLAIPTVSSLNPAFAQSSHPDQHEHMSESMQDDLPISCLCVVPRPTESAGWSRLKADRLWSEKTLSSVGGERFPWLNLDAWPSGTTGQGDDIRH
jgi:hypothetical protein